MIRNILILLLLPVSIHLNAQGDFRNGKIVTNKGDTLYGTIQYQIFGHGGDDLTIWDDGNKQVLNSWNISKIYFDNNYTFKYFDGERNRYRLLIESDSSSVLFHRGELYLMVGDTLYHLNDKKKTRIVNGRTYQTENKEYLFTTSKALKGCESDFTDPMKRSLSKASTTKTYRNYIKCVGGDVAYSSPGKSLGVFAEIHLNRNLLKIDNRVLFGGDNLDPSYYTSLVLGLDVDLIQKDKLKLYAGVEFAEASYHGFSNQPETFKINPDNPDYEAETWFSYDILKFPLGLQFINKIKAFRYGFSLGYFHSAITTKDFRQLVTFTDPNDGSTYTEDYSSEIYFNINKIKGPEGGLNIGYDLGRFCFEMKAKYSRANVYYKHINADVGISHNLSIGLHTRLNIM